MKLGTVSALLLTAVSLLTAAVQSPIGSLPPAGAAPAISTVAPQESEPESGYKLKPGDEVRIHAFHVEEIPDAPFRLDDTGYLDIPMIGRLKAAGLTVQDLESELRDKLNQYIRNPQVSVILTDVKGSPVILTGAFRSPGVVQLKGRKTLLEIIAASGGLGPDASGAIRIVRRLEYGALPLARARMDPGGKSTSAILSVGKRNEGFDLASNVTICPYDVISADKGEMVYVSGEVNRAGVFELGERNAMPITQLVSMAGGLGREASPAKAIILRPVPNSEQRKVITVDLKKIFTGKAEDVSVKPDDLLYVPRSGSRIYWSNGMLVGMSLMSTILNIAIR
jgi:polysaccharide export outer membrane protein